MRSALRPVATPVALVVNGRASVPFASMWPPSVPLVSNSKARPVLRLLERMHGSFVPSTREYFHFFGLDYDKLKLAKPDALIMHPGPMNRGVEIGSEVADDIDRSLIRQQVEMGVAVRMACLEILSRDLGNNPPVQ